MNSNKYNRKKITEYLYKNSVNTSERKISRPKDNDRITTPVEINFITLSGDALRGEWRLRTSFTGSKSWYELPIQKEKIQEWFEIMKHICDNEDLFESFLEEKETDAWRD